MTEPQVSAALARTQAREDISRIAYEHGAHNVRVFGSAGRGEASAHDLDLLVEMAEDRNLLDLIALSQELEDTLGIDVDVLTEDGLSPYLRDRILAEAVALWDVVVAELPAARKHVLVLISDLEAEPEEPAH